MSRSRHTAPALPGHPVLSCRASHAGRVYIEEWETFFAEAEKLYTEHPAHVRASCAPQALLLADTPLLRPQTRYVVKYRHCDGKLVLKVTNDRVCLKFATDQAQDAKRMEKLNNLFFSYMCGKDPHQEEEDGAPPLAHDAPLHRDAAWHRLSASCRFSHADPMAPTGSKPVSAARLVETLVCHQRRWGGHATMHMRQG